MTSLPQRSETSPTTPRRKRGRPRVEVAPYDSADYLTTPERELAYLEAAFEEDSGDGKLITLALGAIARARGMAEVAETAGLNPTTLYRSLSPATTPSLATALRVLRALGYVITPCKNPDTKR